MTPEGPLTFPPHVAGDKNGKRETERGKEKLDYAAPGLG